MQYLDCFFAELVNQCPTQVTTHRVKLETGLIQALQKTEYPAHS